MLMLLRYYYYRYLFPFDPSNTWLRHTVKTIIAVALGLAVSLIRGHIVLTDLWLLLPHFFIHGVTGCERIVWAAIEAIVLDVVILLAECHHHHVVGALLLA